MKILKVDFKDLPKVHTPVLNYCRKLIEDGEDPHTSLQVYRGKVLTLTIHGIGEAARLTIKEDPKLRLVPFEPMSVESKARIRNRRAEKPVRASP